MPSKLLISKITVNGDCPQGHQAVNFKVKRLKADENKLKKDELKCEMYGLICPQCNQGSATTVISGGLTILQCSVTGLKYACPNGCNYTSNMPGICKFCKSQLVKVSVY